MKTALVSLLLASISFLSIAEAQTKKLPRPGETFRIEDCTAFTIEPQGAEQHKDRRPWVWYAPTLPGLPSQAETWMFDRLLAAGIAIAGIDVGESYGSPEGTERE